MKAIIEQLRTLNEIDVRLGMVKRDIERLPRELAEKQAPIKSQKLAVERAKAELVKLKVSADAAELDVKAGEEALKRLSNQMNVLKSSKEWDAVKRQMDAQRGWNRDNEGKELALLDQVETKQKEIEKQTAAIEALEAATTADAERTEKDLGELRALHEELDAQRAKLYPEIPDKELQIYIRIAGTRGEAISHVKVETARSATCGCPRRFRTWR